MEGRKIIKWALAGILIATIVGYSCFVLYDYFRGPRIIILSPESGFSTTTPVIAIIGHAIHVSTLTINGVAAPYDLKGDFQNQLILAEGYNIMKVAAKDHYGRTAEKTIELTLIPKERDVATTTIKY